MSSELECAECGKTGPDVQMYEPLSPDEGEPMPLCSDCYADYVAECQIDQSYREAMRHPEVG